MVTMTMVATEGKLKIAIIIIIIYYYNYHDNGCKRGFLVRKSLVDLTQASNLKYISKVLKVGLYRNIVIFTLQRTTLPSGASYTNNPKGLIE